MLLHEYADVQQLQGARTQWGPSSGLGRRTFARVGILGFAAAAAAGLDAGLEFTAAAAAVDGSDNALRDTRSESTPADRPAAGAGM